MNGESHWNGNSAMDPSEPFLTEEFFRYSAECRRLARLARKPISVVTPGIGAVAYLRWLEWLDQVSEWSFNPPVHRPQFVAGGRGRR
jgi:hypothetical protein